MRKYLADYPDVEVGGADEDGLSAIEMIDTLRPDPAFLDVELPEVASIEILARVRHRP